MDNIIQFPTSNRYKVEQLFMEIKGGNLMLGDQSYVSLIEILLSRPQWVPTERHISALVDIKGRLQNDDKGA